MGGGGGRWERSAAGAGGAETPAPRRILSPECKYA